MLSLLPICILGVTFATYGECESIFVAPKELNADGWEDNPVYSLDENVKIEWETDRKGPCNLFVWQIWPTGPLTNYEKILGNTTDTSCVWNASSSTVTSQPWLNEDSQIPVFHFSLYSSDLNIPLVSSGTFNVSDTKSSELEPSHTASTSSASAISTETDSPAISRPAESSQIPATEPHKSGLPTAALVGISVGVTAVGLSIFGIIGFLLWKRSRRDRGGSQSSESSSDIQDFSKAELGGNQILQIGRSELNSDREPQELWDTQKMAELGDENKVRVVVGLHEAP
ncbi:hypothetical protein FVEN_g11584 [Fusarium venenatum]|uniref:Mid2 domain-containing protein n=1 Tax=Fusarium venenatum TaxID=56646 RepID=A0A2L2TBJ8_9HYPO|nr:uncharacterized protein FVRRES_03950 [Fusarium venenatum]KAG8350231.1 hypothetical protein FVEN_g11584 [Fusarium venenatum]KAH7003078.1 hypothetical protein EDB82DRAFT_482561 [Fusarium venenatum]CEI67438.1 unnamed protein product [Fusarium venenatum]